MGRQHGRQVRELRPQILQAMEERLAALEQREIDLQPYVAEIASVWEVAAQHSILDPHEGCTTWAAAAPVT